MWNDRLLFGVKLSDSPQFNVPVGLTLGRLTKWKLETQSIPVHTDFYPLTNQRIFDFLPAESTDFYVKVFSQKSKSKTAFEFFWHCLCLMCFFAETFSRTGNADFQKTLSCKAWAGFLYDLFPLAVASLWVIFLLGDTGGGPLNLMALQISAALFPVHGTNNLLRVFQL